MSNDLSFLDTSGWISLLNTKDPSHALASRTWSELGRRGASIVATDWVVAETGNGLARGLGRSRFTEGFQRLRDSPRGRLVFIDDGLLKRAFALYEARGDKSWGLVDCASFVVMSDLGIRDAFTSDRHFEPAGFRCLLPGPDGRDGTSNGPTQ